MSSAISAKTSPLTQRTLTLIRSSLSGQTQARHFARWVPYKPLPKPKQHQKLRAIKTLKSHLENCYLVSPFTCHGFSCNQFKALKKPLLDSPDPTATKLVVAKNSLVSKALAGTPWESLAPCLKGMNALLFVKKEEVVAPAMGGVKNVVKEGKLEFNEFTGAVVDGRLYGHLDLKVLESAPSKLESDGMLLGPLYSPASTLIALLQGFGEDDSSKASEGGNATEGNDNEKATTTTTSS